MDYMFINTEYIESVAGGDNETVRELITMFAEQAVEIGLEMRQLYKNSDYYSLGLLAHKAKSSVSIMGMTELSLMLKTFEQQAKENKETDKYESYITKFENDTKSAIGELENFLSNLK
jgi:HPt (histidine-containing phosphotransfer) domain-containing protein